MPPFGHHCNCGHALILECYGNVTSIICIIRHADFFVQFKNPLKRMSTVKLLVI